MKCYVFFDDVKSFSDYFVMMKIRNDNSVHRLNKIPANPGISVLPSISYEQAIGLAKQEQNFESTCIQYRLGIYNTNAGFPETPKNYVLTWKIQGDNGFPYVIIDANNGEVYVSDDGIRY